MADAPLITPVAPPVPVESTELGNPFAATTNVFTPSETELNAPEPLPARSVENVDRTARIATVANMDPSLLQAYDVLDQMNKTTGIYRNMLATTQGEQTVRMRAAQDQRLDAMKALSDQYSLAKTTGVDASGYAKAFRNIHTEDLQERAKYALELKAVTNIQALAANGDVTQARVAKMVYDNPFGAEGEISNMQTKQMIMQREVEKAQISIDDQPWFLHALNSVASGALSMVPFHSGMNLTDNVDYDKSLQHWYTGLLSGVFPGNRADQEASALNQIPIEKFSDYVKDHLIPEVKRKADAGGYFDKGQYLNILTHLTARPSVLGTNIQAGFDNFGLLGPGEIKSVFSAPRMLIMNGGRKEAAVLMADAIRAGRESGLNHAEVLTGVPHDDIAAAVLPKIVNAEPINAVSVGQEAIDHLERSKAVADRILPEMYATDRTTNQVELQAMVTREVEKAEQEFNWPVKDVSKPYPVELSAKRSIKRVDLTVGPGHATEEEAAGWAESVGLGGVSETVRDESGQYFTKISRDINESGLINTNMKSKATNWLARKTLSASQIGDEISQGLASVGEGRKAKILGEAIRPLVSKLNRVYSWEKKNLAEIVAAGETNGVWLTDDELKMHYKNHFGHEASDRVVDSYHAYKDLNDFEWGLRNEDIYIQEASRGARTVSFEIGAYRVQRENAVVDRTLETVPKVRVYDVSSGVHYTQEEGSKLTEEILAKAKADGKILVKTRNPQTIANGAKVDHFLVEGRALKDELLKTDQLGYREGGHRIYKGKHFVKQAAHFIQPDTLKKALVAPNVFRVTETRAQAVFLADKLEAMRVALKGGADQAALDIIRNGHAGLPTGAEFQKMVRDGLVDMDNKIGAYGDRIMPDEYSKIGDDSHLYLDPDETGVNGYLRSTGRLFYGGKGDKLLDFAGREAPTFDPYTTVNRALTNVASLTSFSDYKLNSVARWANTFRDYIENAGTRSDMDLFMNGRINPGQFEGKDRIFNAMEGQREVTKRVLGWKTPEDLWAEQQSKTFQEWVLGDSVDGARHNIVRPAMDWFQNHNPVASMRGMAFDMKLGLFNVAQFPLQISTMAASLSLHPKFGIEGFGNLYGLQHYLTKAGTEASLEAFAKNGQHLLAGFKNPEDWKMYMRAAKRSGFFNISDVNVLVNNQGTGAALGDIGQAIQKARSSARVFFTYAESLNRSVAFHIGYKETLERFPELAVDSPEFLARVMKRSNDYSFNMNNASAAYWQKGLLSIPTQFWAYNTRMLEALLGKGFTLKQKASLLFGQTLLYGSAGFPIIGAFSDYIVKKGYKPPPDSDPNKSALETFVGAANRGLLDEAIYHLSGQDILVGKRLGTGAWTTDVMRDFFGLGQYGSKSAADMLGGATYSIMKNTVAGAIATAVPLLTAELGQSKRPLTAEAFKRMSLNISTVSNIHKAMLMWQFGTYESNTGATPVAGLHDHDMKAVLVASLGFQPGRTEDVAAMMQNAKERKKVIDEAAKVLGNYRTRWVNEESNRTDIEEEISAYFNLLPKSIQPDVTRKMHRDTSDSIYTSLLQQTQKRQFQDQQIEENDRGVTDSPASN